METVYRLENLRFFRGESFSLQIEKLALVKGGSYTLVGANGSGKSTLLKILAFLLHPQQGSLIFNGAVVGNRPRHLAQLRQQVTLVEQSPYLFSGSVYENMAYGLRLRKLAKDQQQRQIAEALQRVGLPGSEEHNSRQLSDGQLQRVALARALVLKPQVLLLDEPTSNCDREHRQIFEQLLLSLKQQGTTVIFSSHDLQQSPDLGSEVLQLAKGRLLATGPLCEPPRSPG